MEIYWEQLANKSLYVSLIGVIFLIGLWFNLSEWAYFRRLRRDLQAYRSGPSTAGSYTERVVGRWRAMQARSGARASAVTFVDADTLDLRVPLLILPLRVTIPGVERGVRTCSSITIAIGLIGTFLGLTVSLISLKGSLSALEAASEITTRTVLEGIVAKLREPLEGMSLAFLTSVSGVLSSAALTGLVTWLSGPGQREAYVAELEAFLQNELPAPAESGDAADVLRALLSSFRGLEQNLQGGLMASARAIENLAAVLGPAAGDFEVNGSRMTEAALRMESASTRLEGTSSQLVTGLERMDSTLLRVSDSLSQLESGMAGVGDDNRQVAGTLAQIQYHLFAAGSSLEDQVKGLKEAGTGLAAAVMTLSDEKQQLGREVTSLRQQGAGLTKSLQEFQGAVERFGGASGKLQGDLSQFLTQYESRMETALGRQFADLHLSLETLRRVLEQSGAESTDRLELILETIRDGLVGAGELTAASSNRSNSGGGAV